MSSFRVLPSRSVRRQYAGVEPYDQQLAQQSPSELDPALHGTPTIIERNSYEPSQQPDTAKQDYIHVKSRSSPFADSIRTRQKRKLSLAKRYPAVTKTIRRLLIFIVVAFIFAIPVLVTRDAREAREGDSDSRRKRNTIYFIFIMLFQAWGMSGVFYAIAIFTPYAFRTIAHFVNPAHERYWRIFFMLRGPFVCLFAIVSLWVSLFVWIKENDELTSYYNNPDETDQDRLLAQALIAGVINTFDVVLTYFMLWAGVYVLEKCLIIYMTLHFHSRAHSVDILQSKKLVDALAALYQYSYTIYPQGHSMFAREDYIIHLDHDSTDGVRSSGRAMIGSADTKLGDFVHGFGVVFGSETTTHWFSPRSSYAIINTALQHPAASAALAKRIWMSLVAEKSNALTLQDVKDAFGPRDARAAEYFETLDQNENGDVTLPEMVDLLVESGTRRKDIYTSMGDIGHVINTIDWMMLGMLAIIMLFLVLVSRIDLLKDIKDLIGFSVLGLGFVIGRTLHEFVQGAIFTVLDHPYDVGDAVEIYTLQEHKQVKLIVKRISLLYTTFEEVGSGKCVQYANMRSKIKRINNLSRSGKNQESITFSVDHSTTFKDIELFKQEMSNFITSPENSRDYDPNVVIRVAGIGSLDKMDIRVTFKHKSNFSNDSLRSARSSRMHCAIMAAARKVPLGKPGTGSLGASLGDAAKPQYTVMLTQDEAAERKKAKEKEVASKRIDYDEEKEEDEKAALAAAEEAAATRKFMGVGTVTERAGSSSGLDQGQFTFIYGDERGVRMRRQY